MWLVLMRMAAVNDRVSLIQTIREGPLIGLDLKLVRHHTSRVGQHAVCGDDCVAFDGVGALHVARVRWRRPHNILHTAVKPSEINLRIVAPGGSWTPRRRSVLIGSVSRQHNRGE